MTTIEMIQIKLLLFIARQEIAFHTDDTVYYEHQINKLDEIENLYEETLMSEGKK